MSFVYRLIVACVIVIFMGSKAVQAAVITAQLSDENPGIKGSTYVDGNLIQEMILGTESYDGRFTGFTLLNQAVLIEDVAERVNVYDPSTSLLIGTLRFSGNAGTGFVHTSYFSTFPGAELEPLVFATRSLFADGTFQNIMQFTADNGDHYVFQYKNVVTDIPEPPVIITFYLSVALLLLIHHRRRKFAYSVQAERYEIKPVRASIFMRAEVTFKRLPTAWLKIGPL